MVRIRVLYKEAVTIVWSDAYIPRYESLSLRSDPGVICSRMSINFEVTTRLIQMGFQFSDFETYLGRSPKWLR